MTPPINPLETIKFHRGIHTHTVLSNAIYRWTLCGYGPFPMEIPSPSFRVMKNQEITCPKCLIRLVGNDLITNPSVVGNVVIDLVAERTGFSSDDIRSPLRNKSLIRARHLTVGALKVLGLSYNECGVVMHKHHTSSMNSWDRVQADGELMSESMVVAELAKGRMNGQSDNHSGAVDS